MVFSSLTFLFLFLPGVLALYFIAPRRLRNPVLLAASLVFYAWGEGRLVLLMVGSGFANWGFGLAIGHAQNKRTRLRILWLALFVNLGILVFYKYTRFIIDNLNPLAESVGFSIPVSNIALPIGISFFTFQALSYVIDVYHGRVEVQRRVDLLTLYIALFPQLIAGPIVRYRDIASQISERVINRTKFTSGIGRFVTGLGKKVLIANPTGMIADQIFGSTAYSMSADVAWIGVLAYAMQIYFDFSGYSDMAIGLGRMFGFDFLENFRHPYSARSISDFWRRWHISLSTWFRDYLYIPLGGNRCGSLRTFINLWVVFLLCGLWHGAAWTFVLWGAYHGTLLVLERSPFGEWLKSAARPLQHLYVWLAFLAGWVLFRAETLSDAWVIFKAMLGYNGWFTSLGSIPELLGSFNLVVLGVGLVFCWPIMKERGERMNGNEFAGVRIEEFCAGCIVFFLCVLELYGGTHNPFIYFRF